MNERKYKPIKDENNAHPIADEWRPIIEKIVCAFVSGDYDLKRKIDNVEPIDPNIAKQNQEYVEDYGEVLVELTEEVWERSCAQWMGTHWEILVDLCTENEGISDLVLSCGVSEVGSKTIFSPSLIYVP